MTGYNIAYLTEDPENPGQWLIVTGPSVLDIPDGGVYVATLDGVAIGD